MSGDPLCGCRAAAEAMAAKREKNIHTIQFPRYSPDLNPMDYFVWAEVEQRMVASKPRRLESKDAFAKRLRTTALAIPSAVIRKGVADLKARARNCYENDGRVVTWE